MPEKFPCRTIILLASWRVENPKKNWLHVELERIGYNVVTLDIPEYNIKNREIKWREILLWSDYLKLALRGIRIARRNDGAVVVACHSLVGVFVSLLSNPLSSTKRLPVIALNMIIRDKGIWIRFIRWFFYRNAFLSDQFLVTVSASELRDQYIKQFKIKFQNISVLRDCHGPVSIFSEPNIKGKDFVFSGGEADRDWHTLISVAKACPEIFFKVVARQRSWPRDLTVPSNVEVLFDTNQAEFYKLVSDSRIVLLPLMGTATAGLIVQKRSIKLGKLVIATNTPATVAYYPHDCKDLLVQEADVQTMTSNLRYYWHDPDACFSKVKKLQDHLRNNFSAQAYASQISELINVSLSNSESGYKTQNLSKAL